MQTKEPSIVAGVMLPGAGGGAGALSLEAVLKEQNSCKIIERLRDEACPLISTLLFTA
jgi:hypothetical protein